ncbi:MAG: DUF3316 domain-containing protein [Paramuribaculum sp.]|nr:DUF3316 domain-containing protein [Paramuribaculum sp.]
MALFKAKIVRGLFMMFMAISVAMPLKAQSDSITAENSSCDIIRPVMSAYTIEAGGSNLADTYLSPIKYSGWALGLRYERMQAMKFNPENWIMKLTADIHLDRTLNKVGNATMWYAGVAFEWGMTRRYSITPSLTLGYGGSASLNAGCLYTQRNGNNPASAKAALTLNLTGFAAWSLKVGSLPVTLIYQPVLPVTGIFFSPDYGELYYEIFLGNHTGLVHPAWWGNYFSLNNRLTADLHFGSTSLRIGYACNILSTKVSNITTRMVTNEAILGISGEWISLNPRKSLSKKAKIIRAAWK